MTIHTWKPTLAGYVFDPTNYVDGTAFAAGDTLVVNGGTVQAFGQNGNVGALVAGNYQFTASAASSGMDFHNIQLTAGSTISVAGPQLLQWQGHNQFINDGLVQIGSATQFGNVLMTLLDDSYTTPSSITNNGSIVLQNGSRMQFNAPGQTKDVLLNAAGGVISINSGSDLDNYAALPDSPILFSPMIVTNNGVIEVNGAAGKTTRFWTSNGYSGAGLLSIRGTPGASPLDTYANIDYGGSGVFDIASGTLTYNKAAIAGAPVLGGTVKFLDANARFQAVDQSLGSGTVAAATINGFQAGDHINLLVYDNSSSFSYDPSTHKLTIQFTPSGGQSALPPAQFTFAGNYTQSDFKVTNRPVDSTTANFHQVNIDIETTSTANAITPFSILDTKTGAASSDAGQQYSGGVNYLQSQYIWAGQDSVNIASNLPNVFIKGGAGDDALTASAGSNVLDGGFGSNFIVGASGADGGRDTFFLDGTAGTTWDTIMNFHPGDSATLWGYVAGTSAMLLTGNEGAAGHTGATIHAAFAGAGTAINGSLTFAGLSLADAQTKLTMTPGNAGGRSYLYVHYNG